MHFTNQQIICTLPLEFLHNYHYFGSQAFKPTRSWGQYNHWNLTMLDWVWDIPLSKCIMQFWRPAVSISQTKKTFSHMTVRLEQRLSPQRLNAVDTCTLLIQKFKCFVRKNNSWMHCVAVLTSGSCYNYGGGCWANKQQSVSALSHTIRPRQKAYLPGYNS